MAHLMVVGGGVGGWIWSFWEPNERSGSPCGCGFLKCSAVLLGPGFHVFSWKHCQHCPLLFLVTGFLARGEQAPAWVSHPFTLDTHLVHVLFAHPRSFAHPDPPLTISLRYIFLKGESPVGSLWISITWFLILYRQNTLPLIKKHAHAKRLR